MKNTGSLTAKSDLRPSLNRMRRVRRGVRRGGADLGWHSSKALRLKGQPQMARTERTCRDAAPGLWSSSEGTRMDEGMGWRQRDRSPAGIV